MGLSPYDFPLELLFDLVPRGTLEAKLCCLSHKFSLSLAEDPLVFYFLGTYGVKGRQPHLLTPW